MAYAATARIPTRPLSYDNLDLAENCEIIVDYKTGLMYVKNIDGVVIDITETVTQTVITNIESNPDFAFTADKITITVEGQEFTIDTVLLKALADIQELKDSLGFIKDPTTGEIVIKVNAADVTTDATHQFVTDTEKTTWNNKSRVRELYATIRGGASNWSGTEAPYTQTISVTGVKEIDSPIIDIMLDCTYSQATSRMDAFAKIYRITTAENSITAYAHEAPETDIPIQIKVDRQD